MKYMIILFTVFLNFYAYSEENRDWSIKRHESSYERMGRLHNEGLDHVFETIMKNIVQTGTGKPRIPTEEEIYQMCCDFTRSKGYEIQGRDREIKEDIVKDFSFLSVKQQEWLALAKQIVLEANLPEDLEKFTADMKNLEIQLEREKELSKPQKEVLLYVMAVCRYSARYWVENHEKWQVEIGGVDVSTRKLQTRSENGAYVSKEWWEAHKYIVWADGVGGVKRGEGYYLENAMVDSVKECLGK